MKFRRTALSVSIALIVGTLTACGGGGGGGGGSSTMGPLVRPDVPYYAPVRVGTVTPVNSPEREYDSSSLYSQKLSDNSVSGNEVIIAGRMAPDAGTYYTYNLSIFGWQNGQLVDKSSQWFLGADRRIVGTEPSVKFADFDGDGRKDMYVSPYTDTNVYGPGSVFFNNGSNFTRVDIDLGNTHGHDSTVYDLNSDGRSDIITMGMTFSFANANRTFTTYRATNYPGGGASVAAADFLGNGTSTLIITDMDSGSSTNNRLYSWSISGSDVVLNQVSVLPPPRFTLPKWAGYNFAGSHDIRALAFDFDNSGRTSAVIFSRPAFTNGVWPEYSEIQFLKNQGGGVFIDVTDNTLIGYNTKSASQYNPTLMDVNNDGLIDIVLGGASWSSGSPGSQVLIHTREHKYVASYATVLQAFQDQALTQERLLNATAESGANGVVFVKGPNNDLYLVTAVSYVSGGQQQKALYLSRVGSNTVNAQATADSIRQVWPWMSPAQVNQVLAQSSTTWFGLNVLDPSKALSPVGELRIPGINRSMTINGSVGGLALNGAANHVKVLDSLGRDFNINMSSTAFSMTNMFARSIDAIDDDTRSAQIGSAPIYRFNGLKFGASNDNLNMVLGVGGIQIAKDTFLSAQYTKLPFSPFVQLNGSWGLVRSSDTIETSVNYRKNGWTAKTGLMYSATTIDAGLVTRVNPITSMWTEAGYEWSSLKLYTGTLPRPVAGSANLSLPTSVDTQGKVHYTNTKVDVYGPTVQYARMSYNDRINRHVSYRVNGMVTTTRQHSVVGELRINF